MGSSQLVDGMTTTTGGVLKWLTSAKSADAETMAVVRTKPENPKMNARLT